MATEIELFVGTSQDFLLSFKVKKTDDDNFVMERVIAHRCHNGAILCMDTNGRYLATGGSDDKIVIIDLKLNRDVQEIVRHEGSVNSLSFTNKGSDLLSGSDDGRLLATTVGSWKLANIWKKPHTGRAVLKVCLHVSDKFALTLGKDGTLRGWDMLKGSQIKTFNTKDMSDAKVVLDNIEVCPNGGAVAMSGEKTVTLFSFTRTEPYNELTLKSKVTSLCWLDDENLLVGMENGSIEWANINTSIHVNLPNVHTRRIKGMHFLKGFLGTICSTGSVALWATTISSKQLTLICTVTDDSVRPTCIKLIDTTKNRYKEQVPTGTDTAKENLCSVVAKASPISTIRTVVIEEDTEEICKSETNEDDDIDIDIGLLNPRQKKTLKPSDDIVKNITPPSQSRRSTPRSLQKRKTAITAQKPIIPSENSDDDFEVSKPKRKAKIEKKRKRSISNDIDNRMQSNGPIKDTPKSCRTVGKKARLSLSLGNKNSDSNFKETGSSKDWNFRPKETRKQKRLSL